MIRTSKRDANVQISRFLLTSLEKTQNKTFTTKFNIISIINMETQAHTVCCFPFLKLNHAIYIESRVEKVKKKKKRKRNLGKVCQIRLFHKLNENLGEIYIQLDMFTVI